MENTENVVVENKEVPTHGQAVNDDQQTQERVSQEKEVPVVADQSDTDDFVMPDDQSASEDEKLAPWMKERLAREKRKADRKQQEIDELQERVRRYEMHNPTQGQAIYQTGQSNTAQDNPEEIIRRMIRDEVTRADQFKAQQSQAQKAQSFKSKLDRGFEKYQDFDIVYSDSAPVTHVMTEYLSELNDPDDFSYNLVKFNSDKLAAISKLSPAKQIVQLDNLYKSFSQKVKGKRFSNAPIPPEKVPSSSAVNDDWSSASFDQLRKMIRPKRRQ